MSIGSGGWNCARTRISMIIFCNSSSSNNVYECTTTIERHKFSANTQKNNSQFGIEYLEALVFHAKLKHVLLCIIDQISRRDIPTTGSVWHTCIRASPMIDRMFAIKEERARKRDCRKISADGTIKSFSRNKLILFRRVSADLRVCVWLYASASSPIISPILLNGVMWCCCCCWCRCSAQCR